MKSILCLLVVVAVCGIAQSGELDGISKMMGGIADTDGVANTNDKRENSDPSNPIGDMVSRFGNIAKAPMDVADKFTEGFMEGVGKGDKNGERGKDSKASGTKKENERVPPIVN